MRKVSCVVGLVFLTLAGAARAQEEAPAAAPADTAAPAPTADVAPVAAPVAASGDTYVSRGLTTSAGALKVTLPIVLNLSKDAVLKPVWVPLDLRFGVNDQLEVFINHSAPVGPVASMGGVCLGGKDRGCDKFYNNVNIGGQFSLMKDSALELAALAALMINSLDPSMMSAAIGVNFKYATGPVAVKVAPQLGIGLNKRSEGNKEDIFVPVQVAFQATTELAAFLDTGITGPTDHFGDLYSMFLGVGAAFAAAPNLDVGGELMLPSVATGASGNKAFDSRWLGVFATYRTK